MVKFMYLIVAHTGKRSDMNATKLVELNFHNGKMCTYCWIGTKVHTMCPHANSSYKICCNDPICSI